MWGGIVLLSLARWWQSHAELGMLLTMLLADLGLGVQAMAVWCVLGVGLVAVLTERTMRVLMAVAGALLLLLAAALDVYYGVAGVALGADVLAYSWDEITHTWSAAQVQVPAALTAALVLGWAGLVWAVWPRPRAADTAGSPRFTGAALALCLLGNGVWASGAAHTAAQETPLARNKLAYFVQACVSHAWGAAGRDGGAQRVAFDHPENTPDTLGPWLALDGKAPPHIVIVIVEGLGRSFSGPDARLGSFTPFLDTLAQRSLYWDNFLATQGRTFAVLPSVLGSLPFGNHGAHALASDTLPSVLKSHGYRLRYFTGTDLAFDQQGAFLKSVGFDQLWSERDFPAGQPKANEWGHADGEVLQALLRQPLPTSPSLTVVQTISMHSPFVFNGIAPYRQRVQERIQALGIAPEQRAAYQQQQDIYATVMYTDDALRQFFTEVWARPQWQNTVFVITGDHRLPEIPMASWIERYHVPLLVHTPRMREGQRFKAVSSHFDIAPSLLALLSHRHGLSTPARVHWMGTGLDAHTSWRNVHALPLKQTKTELSDYLAGEYFLSQGKLFSLQDGLTMTPEDDDATLQRLREELGGLRSAMATLDQASELVPQAERIRRVTYDASQRSLERDQRAREVQGVVVSQTQARFEGTGSLGVQGVFRAQGARDSAVFVPLLVLSDPQGREVGEVSGQAMQLSAGESQTVSLSMPDKGWPAGTYYVSLIVSHPDTGRSIGRGQYHVQVRR